jgi:hypothetical protein
MTVKDVPDDETRVQTELESDPLTWKTTEIARSSQILREHEHIFAMTKSCFDKEKLLPILFTRQ